MVTTIWGQWYTCLLILILLLYSDYIIVFTRLVHSFEMNTALSVYGQLNASVRIEKTIG